MTVTQLNYKKVVAHRGGSTAGEIKDENILHHYPRKTLHVGVHCVFVGVILWLCILYILLFFTHLTIKY